MTVIPDFGRNQLASLTALLGFTVGVEVGVAAGGFSKVILDANPKMELYGVDPWTPYGGYRDYARKSTLDTLEIKARRLLKGYDNYEFIKAFSMDAVQQFSDGSLDFVYIDANHQEPYVSQDINEWYRKLRPRGILSGHDYVRSAHRDGTPLYHDVKNAIHRFTNENGIELFILGNEAIDEGLVRDRPRSWMLWKR